MIKRWAVIKSHFYTLIMCVLSCASHVWLVAIPWTIDHQAPPSVGFSRQENWSGLLAFLQGIFPTQGSNLSLCLTALASGFFTTSATWDTHVIGKFINRPLQRKGYCLSFFFFLLPIGIICCLLSLDWACHFVSSYFRIWPSWSGCVLGEEVSVKWNLLCRELAWDWWTMERTTWGGGLPPSQPWGLIPRPVKKKKELKELFELKDWWRSRRRAHCLSTLDAKGPCTCWLS